MGKGSRNRQVRVDDVSVNPQKYVQKKSAPKYPSYIAIAVVIVVAVALIFSVFSGSGIFLRMQTPVQSEHFEVSGTMMSYFAHTVYSRYVNQYEQNYGSYINSSSGFTIYDLMGIDRELPLSKQLRDEKTGETWQDYFTAEAAKEVENLLLYCEGAYEAGIELDEAELAAIDDSIDLLGLYGQMYGYSAKSYLQTMYGAGVNAKDVRKAMMITELANKYLTTLDEGFREEVEASDVEAFFQENKNDYLSADYLTYKIDADIAEDATDEQIDAAKAEVDAIVETILAANTVDDFRAAVKAHLATEITAPEGDDDFDVDAEIEKKLDAMAVEKYAYYTGSNHGKILFGEGETAAAAVNTTFKVVSDTTKPAEDAEDETDTKKAYSVSVYFVTRAASRDEDKTTDVAYIALPKSAYTEEKANEVLAAFEEGGKNKDAMLALNEKYTDNVACTFVENTSEGFFGAEAADEWAYSDERKPGDYEMISATISSTEYYILILVDAEGDEVWYVAANEGLIASMKEDWLEEAGKTYPVRIDDKKLDNIKM